VNPWQALVATAVVGTARRPPPPLPAALGAPGPAGAAGGSPEASLLTAAALLGTQRRAGWRPRRALGPLPSPAPDDPRPAAPDPAVQILELLLAGEAAVSGDVLLREWLDRCASAGRRPPARLLPELLALGTAKPSLRLGVAAAAGPPGAWLGWYRAEWAWTTGAGDDDESLAERLAGGSRAERVEALTRWRRRAPGAARAQLPATWSEEPAAERAALLAALREGLSPSDERFLEAALDDRAAGVRAVAASLLDGVPGSGGAARMAARLAPLVTRAGRRRRSRLEVSFPPEPDRVARRDGLTDAAPQGMGLRSWWLVQIVAGAPLGFWEDHLGLPPPAVVHLASSSPEVLAGLERAASAQREQRWAEALLPHRPVPALVAVAGAPAGEILARYVADRRDPDLRLPALLAAVPAPWPAVLSAAVIDRYRRLGGRAVTELHDAVPVLAGGLDPGAAPAVAAWAETLREETLRRRVRRLHHALTLRHTIALEFG
jgi:hypothetical protein